MRQADVTVTHQVAQPVVARVHRLPTAVLKRYTPER